MSVAKSSPAPPLRALQAMGSFSRAKAPVPSSDPTGTSPIGMTGATLDDLDRMFRAVTGLTNELRQLANGIKESQPFSATKRTFMDWSIDLSALATKIDDVAYELRFSGETPKAAAAAPASPKKFNIADLVSQMKAKSTNDSGGVAPAGVGGAPPTSGKPPTPQQTSRPGTSDTMSVTNVPKMPLLSPRGRGGRPGTQQHIHHVQSHGSAVVVDNPAYLQAQLMATSLHVQLDAVLRAVSAASATIYIPVNGNTAHLEAICDVGRGPDTILSSLAVKDEHAAPALAITTGIMVAICRGRDPVTDRPRHADALFNAATETFRESVRMAVAPHASRTSATDIDSHPPSSNPLSPRHAIKTPVAVTHKRSAVWSAVSIPIRTHAGQKPAAAVLHVVNKHNGKANFTPEDEHILFGACQVLAAFLGRVAEPRALARHFVPTRPMPPVAVAPRAGVSIPVPGGGYTDEPLGGYKSQLVWRTYEHPGAVREVKILVRDQAVKLDDRAPVMRVYDYVERLQTAWQRSVLLNVEYQSAFDQRTLYLTALVHKLKSAALKNEMLRGMLLDERRRNGGQSTWSPAEGSLGNTATSSLDLVQAAVAARDAEKREAAARQQQQQQQRAIAAAREVEAARRKGSALTQSGALSQSDSVWSDDEAAEAAFQAARPKFLPPHEPKSTPQSVPGGTADDGDGRVAGSTRFDVNCLEDSQETLQMIQAIESESDGMLQKLAMRTSKLEAEQRPPICPPQGSSRRGSNEAHTPDDTPLTPAEVSVEVRGPAAGHDDTDASHADSRPEAVDGGSRRASAASTAVPTVSSFRQGQAAPTIVDDQGERDAGSGGSADYNEGDSSNVTSTKQPLSTESLLAANP
jgi:type II secretory pathway pseudopilin PulG